MVDTPCPDLSGLPFFASFSRAELGTLAGLLRRESYRGGERIVARGSAPGRALWLVSGEVREERGREGDPGAVGVALVVRCHTPGAQMGLHFLLADSLAAGDLVAAADCVLLSLASTVYAGLGDTNPALAAALDHALCRALMGQMAESEAARGEAPATRALLDDLRLEKKKIQAMHRIASSTTMSSVPKTLDIILAACMDCLAVEKGSVMIHHRGYLRVEAAFGADRAEILGKSQKIADSSVSGRCFLSQRPILIDNIAEAQGLERAGDGRKYHNNSVLSLPLVSLQGESLGVLNVSKTSRELFSPTDLAIVADLAQEASAVLGHEIYLARIFRKFQEACVDIRRGREQLAAMEVGLADCLSLSWAAELED